MKFNYLNTRLLLTVICSLAGLIIYIKILQVYILFKTHPIIPYTDILILPKFNPVIALALILFTLIILASLIWIFTNKTNLLKKKLKILGNTCFITLLLLSIIFYFLLHEKTMTFVGFVVGIIGLIKPTFSKYLKRTIERKYNVIIQTYQDQNQRLEEETLRARNSEIISKSKQKSLGKLVTKINLTLEKENISKQDLVNSLA